MTGEKEIKGTSRGRGRQNRGNNYGKKHNIWGCDVQKKAN